MGGCLNSATFAQAEDRCREHGARLCTLSEVQLAAGGGCGHDTLHVWVWDACAHSGGTEHRVAALGGDSTQYRCDAVSEMNAVVPDQLVTIAGRPIAIASVTGRPQPSPRVGSTKASAAL